MRVLGVRQVDLGHRAAELLDRLSVASKTSSTPASMPPPVSWGGTPTRRPSRRSALGGSTGLGQSRRGRVARVGADHVPQQQRGVGHVAGHRAGLVERGGEGDHAVARHRPVGGLQAHDPAQRRGLADRPAGVGADRPRRGPGGHRGGAAARRAARARARGPTGCAPGRSPSSRSTSPWRTRPCWSCRAARRPRRAGGAPRSRCTAAGSPRGCASRPGSARPRRRTGP